MSDTENQMGLFELGDTAAGKGAQAAPPPPVLQPKQQPNQLPKHQAKPHGDERDRRPVAPVRTQAAKGAASKGRGRGKTAAKGISGQVPEGDVRLTANIRQDLHLKLKIASAYRRTTIGEIIEELVEKYV